MALVPPCGPQSLACPRQSCPSLSKPSTRRKCHTALPAVSTPCRLSQQVALASTGCRPCAHPGMLCTPPAASAPCRPQLKRTLSRAEITACLVQAKPPAFLACVACSPRTLPGRATPERAPAWSRCCPTSAWSQCPRVPSWAAQGRAARHGHLLSSREGPASRSACLATGGLGRWQGRARSDPIPGCPHSPHPPRAPIGRALQVGWGGVMCGLVCLLALPPNGQERSTGGLAASNQGCLLAGAAFAACPQDLPEAGLL